MYLAISFDTDLDFQQNKYKFNYANRTFEIENSETKYGHILYVQTASHNDREAYSNAMNFFSEICWLFSTRVTVLGTLGSGYRTPIYCNRVFNGCIDGINLDDYISVQYNDIQRMALALYREGNNSNSIFYTYLNYYKIINLVHSNPNNQMTWINNNISNAGLTDEENRLISGINDIGNHFYVSGRCAISHASFSSSGDIANPDNYDDYYRISSEISIIKKLAEYIMKNEIHIKKLSELKKEQNLKLITEILENKDNILADVSLSFYRSDNVYNLFQHLSFKKKKLEKNIYLLTTKAKHKELVLSFIIDTEKVKFEIAQILIDKSSSVVGQIEFYKFITELYHNGALELTSNGNLIYRLDYFIPINIDPSKTFENLENIIKELESKL